jgi:fucose permease
VQAGSVLVVYLSGFLQGLTLVSFPAASGVLTQDLGFSDAQYGAIFLPQVALAVAGAIGGAALAGRIGLRALLVAALIAGGLSQGLLAAAAWVGPSQTFAIVLAGTGLLGLGFGFSGAPLNSYPPLLFPRQTTAAVVAAHTVVGFGLTAGPLIAGWFIGAGRWYGWPLILGAACVLVALLTLGVRLPRPAIPADRGGAAPSAHPLATGTFWLFAALSVFYAFAEGTFANWAVVYLREAKGLPEATAGLALSVFWGALVAGRLAVTALVTRIPPEWIWLGLPLLMTAAFLALPFARDPLSGIGLFALAGLACSAFFPLTITLASERFPEHVAAVSSMLIAALMIGVGAGSFAIGALRQHLSFEELYRLSALYPVLALCLCVALVRGRGLAGTSAAPQTTGAP